MSLRLSMKSFGRLALHSVKKGASAVAKYLKDNEQVIVENHGSEIYDVLSTTSKIISAHMKIPEPKRIPYHLVQQAQPPSKTWLQKYLAHNHQLLSAKNKYEAETSWK